MAPDSCSAGSHRRSHQGSSRVGGFERTSSIGSFTAGDFQMHDVDISRNHGHGTLPVPGRESHTSDLNEFDRYVKIMAEADRLEQDLQWDDDDDDETEDNFFDGEKETDSDNDTGVNRGVASAAAAFVKSPSSSSTSKNKEDNESNDPITGMNVEVGDIAEVPLNDLNTSMEDMNMELLDEKQSLTRQDTAASSTSGVQLSQKRTLYPFNPKFWAFVRSILEKAMPVGFAELADPKATSSKGPNDANNFIQKVIAIGPLNPIQPKVIAELGGFDEEEVLAELFYGTLVGLVAMRFSPECIQCGSQVMDTDMLGRVPTKALCSGCNAPNVMESMDKIKVMFLLNSDVLYVLAENYSCTPSSDSMAVTNVFAAVPANSTGSGYSYCVGTGKDTEIAPALEPGRYRMHCPVAKTDNYLVVRNKAKDDDKAVQLNMKVSDLVCNHKFGKKKPELQVPHGKIQFDIFPDTRSFFVLWVQKDVDDKTLMHLPQEERPTFTSATQAIHHPIFNALFQDNQVVAVQKNVFLSISNVVLVFTDIVDSTKLYASLGDGVAFQLVRKHFQVLFGAFTRNGGRVVKTIGDAVMASFTTGKAALTAVSEAMELLPTIGRRPDTNTYVEIRVGIHSGQATVVPLNGVNDYFGQTTNIAARVQSAAKASECFVTETVLDCDEARERYNELTSFGSAFKPTPLTELKLKGVQGKVEARGFRWVLRSRRPSDMSDMSGSGTNYMNRKVNRSYSLRGSFNSIDSDTGDDSRERPGQRGRRLSTLDPHGELHGEDEEEN